uniref:Uncharacterized protein n=1 Tax=Anguilla anguilla TaxID=7936 RepID=A0A0E9PP77_ANGAN
MSTSLAACPLFCRYCTLTKARRQESEPAGALCGDQSRQKRTRPMRTCSCGTRSRP